MQKSSRLNRIILAMVFFVIAFSCTFLFYGCGEENKDVAVTAVGLNKSELQLDVGGSYTLIATVAPENATDKSVTWSSDKETVVTVDANGKVLAIGIGQATVTVTTKNGNKTASCAVTVSPVPVTGVTLDKTELQLDIGDTSKLIATVLPANATNKAVVWQSANPAVATVDGEGTVTAVAPGETMVTVSAGNKLSVCKVKVNAPPAPILVTDFALDKVLVELFVGESTDITVKDIQPENATDKTVTWDSTHSEFATVDTAGKVTAISKGTATIVAKIGTQQRFCEIIVKEVPVSVTGVTLDVNSLEILIGENKVLTATVAPTNATNKNLTWTTSNSDFVTVDSNGKITAVSVGTATITAKAGDVTATCTVEVKPVPVTGVTLGENSCELLIGQTKILTATIAPANATDKTVTWMTSNDSVATVDGNGKITAVSVGTAIITITTRSENKTDTCTVEVKPVPVTSVTLNENSCELLIEETKILTVTVAPTNATDKTVTWTTSNDSVATVDGNGKITAISVGTATITAKAGDKTATCAVEVKPVPVTGVTLNSEFSFAITADPVTLTATVSPANATNKAIIWMTSNDSVATVDGNGQITPIGIGTAIITVITQDGGFDAQCTVTVTEYSTPVQSVSLNENTLTLNVRESKTLTATILPADATNKLITWSSSDSTIATVDQTGKITAIVAGTAIIMVTTADGGHTAQCTVTVNNVPVTGVTLNENSLELFVEETKTLTATVAPDNVTNDTVTWSSSNNGIATVANGVVTAVGVGTAIITVTTADGNKTDTCTVEVNPNLVRDITLTPNTCILQIGEQKVLEVTFDPANATNKKVTWTTSDASIATVDSNGKIEAVGVGTAIITVTTEDGGFTKQCTVEVKPIPVESIILDKITLDLIVKEETTLTATVNPGEATYKTVTWTTSDASVVTVDGNGKITAVKEGTAIITAKAEGKTATCTVTVTKIAVSSVTLSAQTLELKVEEISQLSATVLPDTATYMTVTWSSSDATVATVDFDGNVTAIKAGTATITATADGVSATCQIKVVVPVTSVQLNKTEISIKVSEAEILEANVFPSNATNKTVTWSSNSPDVASVDDSGKITANAVGTAIITVTTADGNKTATCTVTVNPMKVQSITLNMNQYAMEVEQSITLIAKIEPFNATNGTLKWESSNENVATVDQNGKVTAVGIGSVHITAKTTDNSELQAGCVITVTPKPVRVTDLTIDKTAEFIVMGQPLKITATVEPDNATNKTVIWTSSNENVATVDADGNVTTVGAGVTVITAVSADSNDIKKECTVTVMQVYTITYDLDGGENHGDNPNTFTVKSEFAFKAPSKTNCEFLGWYENDVKIEKVELGTEGNKTLVAKWKRVTWTIEYTSTSQVVYTLSGTVDTDIKIGEKFTLPTVTLNSAFTQDYAFGSWVIKVDDKDIKITAETVFDQTLADAFASGKVTLYAKFNSLWVGPY